MAPRFLTLILCISAQLQSAQQQLEKWTQLTATGDLNPLLTSASVFIFIDEIADTEGKPVKDCFSCTFFNQHHPIQAKIEKVDHEGCIYSGPELYHANEFAPDMLTRFIAFQKQKSNWLNMKKETIEKMLEHEEQKIIEYKSFVLSYTTEKKIMIKTIHGLTLTQLEDDLEKCPNPFKTVFYTELLALQQAYLDGKNPPTTPFIKALQHRGLLQSLCALSPTSSS